MFFCAPTSAVASMCAEMAGSEFQVSSSTNAAGELVAPPCRSVLSGGNLERLCQYEGKRREELLASLSGVVAEAGLLLSQEMDNAESSNLTDAVQTLLKEQPCLAHITQTANQKGSYIGQSMGTLIRNSQVWSFTHARINTGDEALQCQGIPRYCDELHLPFRSLLDGVRAATPRAGSLQATQSAPWSQQL